MTEENDTVEITSGEGVEIEKVVAVIRPGTASPMYRVFVSVGEKEGTLRLKHDEITVHTRFRKAVFAEVAHRMPNRDKHEWREWFRLQLADVDAGVEVGPYGGKK